MRWIAALLLGAGLMAGCAVSDKGIAALPDTPVILTVADVTVSDGTEYTVMAGYGPTGSTYRAVYPDYEVHYTTDGETAIAHDRDGPTPLPDDYVVYIQSQLFHAQVAEFAELNDGVQLRRPCGEGIETCREKIGKVGSPRFGIRYLALQTDPRTGIPYALLAYHKDGSATVARFSDWRTENGMPLAYRVTVEDGGKTYDYWYRSIEGL